MIRIEKVENGSEASLAGVMAGDAILRINGEEIRDRLDFEFFRSGDHLTVDVMRGNQSLSIDIEREPGGELGIEPEVMKIHLCKNNCVFCFVHQTPRGMRKSLYVKDEDYRYSFLDGHFTTLSNMKESDWDRVVEQRLSPIYVSVHCTDTARRNDMLKNQKLEPILDRLAWLRDHDLRFHTQMVIVPEWNDGEYLERSLSDLRAFHPWLQSISVVPIGLTRHRDKLPNLRKFTVEDAQKVLEATLRHGREAFAETGEHFIYPSDEIFVQAGAPLPEAEYYGDFNQYENGVGTLRALIDDFERELPSLPTSPETHSVTVLTAPVASEIKRTIMKRLEAEKGLRHELLVCENLTFGDSVTVTGLLCGRDFLAALERSTLGGTILIPPNALNREGIFLDDLSLKDIENKTGRKVIVPQRFRDYFPE